MNLKIGDKAFNFATKTPGKKGDIITIKDITLSEVVVEFKDGWSERYDVKELRNMKRSY